MVPRNSVIMENAIVIISVMYGVMPNISLNPQHNVRVLCLEPPTRSISS